MIIAPAILESDKVGVTLQGEGKAEYALTKVFKKVFAVIQKTTKEIMGSLDLVRVITDDCSRVKFLV